ncbi:thiol-disulfide oxidoreductase DCC family protein [Streptomyces sp. NPDC058470]|uniref:thiol-disulfide oxidoreductase DCC family protein n=1 Tax=Streptomyces sp. NPDC058470 TaxID=3346515 RepID=UPI003659F28C
MAGIPATRDRDAARVPVLGLTVLYDARCSLCSFVRDWLGKQPQLVPLRFVPAGSEEARGAFPSLDHRATLEEITVVGDGGQVYRGSAAWVVCLWALREQRALAHRLSTPAGARLAKGAMLAAAKWRAGHKTGGSLYYGGGGDGWAYHPQAGWTYNPPGCDSGTCSTR